MIGIIGCLKRIHSHLDTQNRIAALWELYKINAIGDEMYVKMLGNYALGKEVFEISQEEFISELEDFVVSRIEERSGAI